MKVLKFEGLEELSNIEMQETVGGLVPPLPPPIPLLAIVGGVATGVGLLLVGCAIGYGVYCIVDWATRK